MRQAVEAQVLSPHCELGEQGLKQVLTDVLEEVRRSLHQDIDGAHMIHSLLNAPWLQSLLKVYECLQRYTKTSPAPALDSASGLSLQVLIEIRALQDCSEDAKELYRLMRQPHLQAVLSAHDSVAQKDYEPVLPALPEELPDDEEASRIVCLVKNKQPLGATIKRNELTGEIFVARVIHGGLADRSGLLHAGDRIMEVNGFVVDGMEPEQVIQVVACSQGTIMFKVVPITERSVHSQTMMYVRAMADYNPQLDPAIPCPDAGVSFTKGDVLEIVDQTDALWWQAKRLPCSSSCAGLVPSMALLKRKQREFWWSQPYQPHACIHTLSTVEEEEDLMAIDDKCVEADEETFESEELRQEEDDFSTSKDQMYLSGFRRSLRLCRRRFHSSVQPSCQAQCLSSYCYSALCSPYEEVVRYQRNPQDSLRLVTLLGTSGVGVNELRRRLIDMNPQLFHGAIPHTSRPPRDYEEPGREYHFVSRDVFENMIHSNKFLEYGEFKGNYYGTSSESVTEVLNSGKICVIDIEPSALQAVRTPELRAYVVYIKPPSAEQLRQTRHSSQILTNYYATRPFKEEDFTELEDSARKLELHFSQFFDHVIINEDLQESCAQLLSAATRAQEQPQWVPTCWIRPPP
ncbi:MAGUK p55 subfamily member 4 isoform X1 [Periophthalmus magnuspinnatus]|uniref:MAGUK p55 subfamily member 4 isoform X1 n=1 Tax=Periophthalmus magnuspinnatus TaxID=409849 RepID=UPI00243636DF|nr:MAGUK p55 subfamily member 4 isoform X1 [Periophthalmus magnuspinnatus]